MGRFKFLRITKKKIHCLDANGKEIREGDLLRRKSDGYEGKVHKDLQLQWYKTLVRDNEVSTYNTVQQGWYAGTAKIEIDSISSSQVTKDFEIL